MIGRRAMLAALLACPVLAQAAPGRARIYMLVQQGGEGALERGFREQLAAHGIDAELVVREPGRDPARLRAVVHEARARGTDLIYTAGAALTLAVAGPYGAADPGRYVTDIPIVFAAVPREQVALLMPPGASTPRNMTGTIDGVSPEHQLDAMLAYRPFRRIAAITSEGDERAARVIAGLRTAARQRGVEFLERYVPQDGHGMPLPGALPEIVGALARQGAQLLYLGDEDTLAASRAAIARSAAARGLPSFTASDAILRDGCALFGLTVDRKSLGRLTALQAIRILRRSTPPARLPVAGLARPSLAINMTLASTLGLYPPVSLLNRAEVLR